VIGLVVQPMFWILLILKVASRRVDSITGPNPTPNVFAKNFFVKLFRYGCWLWFDWPPVNSITGINPSTNIFTKNFFVKKMRYFCWPGFDYPAGELDHWTKSIDKQFH
jgi:hypothetical protein